MAAESFPGKEGLEKYRAKNISYNFDNRRNSFGIRKEIDLLTPEERSVRFLADGPLLGRSEQSAIKNKKMKKISYKMN